MKQKKLDWNELQIRKNSQKATGTKMAEKLNNFEIFERKEIKFQPCSQTIDLDDLPDVLDHLGLVANTQIQTWKNK